MNLLKKHPFAFSIFFLLLVFFSLLIPQTAGARSTYPQGIGPELSTPTVDLSNAKVHGYFFYSKDCSHCLDILNQIVNPLLDQYPGQIDLRLLELSNPTYYQALLKVEAAFAVKPEERGLPTVLIGDQLLIGQEPNEQKLQALIEQGLQGDGIPFPEIEGIDPELMISMPVDVANADAEVCTTENPEACQVDLPIYAAYFYQVGCKECNRVDTDIKYLQTLYPQLVVEEFNIYENTPLATWMAERAGRGKDITVPALFIGDHAWIGEGEITPQALEPVLQQLSQTGSPRFWEDFNPEEGQNALLQSFESIGWLAVVLAGLVDGLNPCAFATIVFFISYLTLSGRKGKEILITGASFTIGVFLAYLLVGLGFYKVLDLVKETLAVVSRIVYMITAGLCIVLAVLSIKDYFTARGGNLEDMTLTLPKQLRRRINATIHEGGRRATRYYIGAFITGLLVSFIELACTGQIYLPTIIFMSSVPSLRGKAVSYLLIYNLMFIIPLIVVFVLAYYGTTSKQLSDFLQKHAAPVKLGMSIVFILLAGWLIFSLVA
jgi:cytochrome c biogenesis protein CcdA